MGNYGETFRGILSTQKGNINTKQIHPKDKNWILNHAKVTKLSIPEVEYLWAIFKKFGSTSDGYIGDTALHNIPDLFTKNILLSFNSSEFPMSFENFLQFIFWCQNLDLKEKLKASFHLANDGRPFDRETTQKIVQLIYSNEQQDEIEKITEMLFEEFDEDKTGLIKEEQFLKVIQELFVEEELKNLLDLKILPIFLQENLDQKLPEFVDFPDEVCSLPETGKLIPCDSVLQKIAKKLEKKDWKRVVNKLGFLDEEIEKMGKIYKNQTEKLIFGLLVCWKDRAGEFAQAEILEKILFDCDLIDAAIVLQP